MDVGVCAMQKLTGWRRGQLAAQTVVASRASIMEPDLEQCWSPEWSADVGPRWRGLGMDLSGGGRPGCMRTFRAATRSGQLKEWYGAVLVHTKNEADA